MRREPLQLAPDLLADRPLRILGVGRWQERLAATGSRQVMPQHLRDGAPLPIDADDAVANMQLVDDCYRAAGFSPRPRTAPL